MITLLKIFYKPFVSGLLLLLCKTNVCNARSIDKHVIHKCGVSIGIVTCENQINPLGIDVAFPRLAWIIKALLNERGQYQTAFQIQVASSKRRLQSGKPDFWDSGRLAISQNNNINYHGNNLSATKRYYWRVRVWDRQHIASEWSKPAFWEMGLLDNADWKGKWIEDSNSFPVDEKKLYEDHPSPIFRREFKAPKTIKRAMMYVSGVGYYEAYLNGKKLGDKLLDPGWTDYSKRVLYSTYDVTADITNGNNCLGVSVGNGWYNPLPLKMWGRKNIREFMPVGEPKFILQLNIEYTDGSNDQIVSDDKWKVIFGPILRNSIYLGEVYDARKEIPGWNNAGLGTSEWRQAKYATAPGGELKSQQQPPIIAGHILKPVKIVKRADGRYIVDFGNREIRNHDKCSLWRAIVCRRVPECTDEYSRPDQTKRNRRHWRT
jgi:alpha-L-rhamnosidase